MNSRKAEDHSPPHASKTNGRRAAPRAKTWDAVSWKVRLGVSTSSKTPSTEEEAEESQEDRGKEDPSKSHTSAPRDMLQGTQISAWRRPAEVGREGSHIPRTNLKRLAHTEHRLGHSSLACTFMVAKWPSQSSSEHHTFSAVTSPLRLLH